MLFMYPFEVKFIKILLHLHPIDWQAQKTAQHSEEDIFVSIQAAYMGSSGEQSEWGWHILMAS